MLIYRAYEEAAAAAETAMHPEQLGQLTRETCGTIAAWKTSLP